MSENAYKAGLAAFQNTFAQETAAWGSKTPRAAGRANAKEDRNWWLDNGSRMVFAYYNWRQTHKNLEIWHTPDGVPAIELQCNVKLPDGTLLKAFIDRVFVDTVTGDLLIVDLKSGKNSPGSALQLATYRLCLEIMFGVSPRHGSYWMARSGNLDTIYDLDQIPPKAVSRWLRDARKAIELQLFVPKVSKDCSWCGVKEFCYTQNPALPRPDFDSDLITSLENG